MSRIFSSEFWHEVFNALIRNRRKTALTAFGVFWGIFMMMLMVGAGKGLENGAEAQFAGIATNTLFIWGGRTSVPFNGLPEGRSINMNNDDVIALRQQCKLVVVISPRIQLGGFMGANNVSRNNKTGGFSVYGDNPQTLEIVSLAMPEGRFLNDDDLSKLRKVAVIGTRVRELLFEQDENPIGDYIYINGAYFQVIGIFESKRGGPNAEREAQSIYVPFTTFQTAFNANNRVGWLTILAGEGVDAALAEEEVLTVLKERHRVSPADTRAFGGFNLQKEFLKINGLLLAIKIITWLVSIGTLAAGIIGVSNIMLILIKERTKEIGIRRAIGASPKDIVLQIILESVTLTTFAGYIGLVLGIGLLELVNFGMKQAPQGNSFFQNPGVDLSTGFAALLILIIAGILAGFFPARRALKIQTVEALRSE